MPDKVIGSRAEVMHGNAKKTAGGLTKADLMYNDNGDIVSKKKHALGLKMYRKNESKMAPPFKSGYQCGKSPRRSPLRHKKSPTKSMKSPKRYPTRSPKKTKKYSLYKKK